MKTHFLIIALSIMASSVYAHSKSCPEAGLSDEQAVQWETLREEFKASVEGLSKEERRAKRAEFHQHVLEVLPETQEQRTALEECFDRRKERRHGRRHKCFKEAELSDGQRDQWRALRSESRQTALDTVPATDEQRAALEQCFEKHREKRGHGKRHKCFEEVGFSDEQRDQWRALRSEFRQYALDNVSATDEQRAVLKQCFERRKKKRGEGHE